MPAGTPRLPPPRSPPCLGTERWPGDISLGGTYQSMGWGFPKPPSPGPHRCSRVLRGETGTPGLGRAPTCPGIAGRSAGAVKPRLAPALVPPEDEAVALLGDTLQETG